MKVEPFLLELQSGKTIRRKIERAKVQSKKQRLTEILHAAGVGVTVEQSIFPQSFFTKPWPQKERLVPCVLPDLATMLKI